MKNKAGYILPAAVFVLLTAAAWFKPADSYSLSERRGLAQLPKVSAASVESGRFMSDFESYTLDQFPLRETFRRIKAVTADRLFGRLDNNEIYVAEGQAAALEYPLNEDSLEYAAEKFYHVYDLYLKDTKTKVYFSVVPDKGYTLAEQNGYLAMDYEYFFDRMQELTPQMEYIDIAGLLEAEDYYATDTHWRQERITDVANTLAEAMNVDISAEYEQVLWTEDFLGVYAGQSALPLKKESMYCLTNEMLENCRVYDYENGKEIAVYDEAKGAGADPYELFVSGPLSLVTIENPASKTGRELILFRDSFGSSIAPLFAAGYEKITLVDIRYMAPQLLGKYVEFTDQDVLFLYSTSVLNHSETLK